MQLLNTKSIGYDDVVLIAQPGKVLSRQEVPYEAYRLVVSGMTSIIGPDFIRAVAKLPYYLQPTLHIPRDIYAEENLKLAASLKLQNVFVGVGLDTPRLELLATLLGYSTVLLDVANGYCPAVLEKVVDLRKKHFRVIAGSVHTEVGAQMLFDVGANVIRSGIGPGSVCISASSTGFTRGPLSDAIALSEGRYEKIGSKKIIRDYSILLDGGIKQPGDIVKAFGMGADYIMSGRIFVDCKEARLRVTGENIYYGQASVYGKKSFGNVLKNIEGRHEKLSCENIHPLKEILETLWDGIRSGISYSGYASVTDFVGNGVFEKLS